jgi:membrane associated rhomboid family serine protease
MAQIKEQLKTNFLKSNIVQQLIYVNIAIYIATLLFGFFGTLIDENQNLFYTYFALSSDLGDVLWHPWSIVTYGFVHASFVHLLMNMLILYYIGNLFLDYFTPKNLLTYYLLGTVFGGLLYLLAYNFIPSLSAPGGAILMGASAGVTAIFIGIATYMPRFEIRMAFIGYVKLWILASIWIFWDLIQLTGDNTGGRLAHLGGALFGFLSMYYYSNGFSVNIDLPKFKKKSPLKTVYKSKQSSKRKPTREDKDNNQQKVNGILDKIGKSGYDSLSSEEKEFLFKQGD